MNINMPIFYISLMLVAIVSIVIGKQLSRKKAEYDQYFLSNRSLKVFPLMLTFLATQLGGGSIIGGAEAAFQHGFYAIYYSLGIALGFFILAFGLGSKFRSLEVATIPEIFGKVYKSKSLQVISSLILIISTFFILVALGVATKKFFLALGISNPLWFIGFWAVIIFYTSVGGFSAVVKTDILQVLFILITFIIIVVFSLYIDSKTVFRNILAASSINTSSSLPWASWLLMPMLFTVIGQDMGQRCFAASSPKMVSKATAGAGMLLVIASIVPVVLGMLASQADIPVKDASVLIQLVEQLTNPAIASLFACSILLAILSTADSLICAISSNISYDILASLNLGQSKSRSLLVKITTVLIGLLAIVASLSFDAILAIMVGAYTLAVCTLFIPVCCGALARNRNSKAISVAFYAGVLSFVGFSLFWSSEYKAIACIIVAFIGYLLGKKLYSKN